MSGDISNLKYTSGLMSLGRAWRHARRSLGYALLSLGHAFAQLLKHPLLAF